MSIEVTVEYAHREWNSYDHVVHIRNYQQLTASVRELEAENAKLHEQVDLQVPKMAFTQLKEQLAAEQLNNKRLREALQAMVNSAADINCGLKIADDALSTPASTEALDAYVKQKIKEYN